MQKPMQKAATVLLLLLFISGQLTVAYAVQEYWALIQEPPTEKIAEIQPKPEAQEATPLEVDLEAQAEEKLVLMKANQGMEKEQNKVEINSKEGNFEVKAHQNTDRTISRGNGLQMINPDDLYWLSRIIHAEARGETYQGKVAVGNVVVNRVKTEGFPDTIKAVVFEYTNGTPQFSPVADGSIYLTPDEESIQAAKDALAGARPVGNATYFFNPTKVPTSWISKTKTYVTTIGDHVFYQ